jgi:hypothetical protein
VTPHSPYTSRTATALTGLVVLLAGVLAALAFTGTAPAKGTPCGEKVLADWYDNGRIDRLYPLHCYEDAIDAIPADIRDYADAEDVISRALQGALSGKLVEGGRDPSPDDREVVPGAGTDGKGGKGGKGGPEATPAVDTSSPSSVPIPLLVLGGMSLALLAAGGLGYVSRRRQAGADNGDVDDDPLG